MARRWHLLRLGRLAADHDTIIHASPCIRQASGISSASSDSPSTSQDNTLYETHVPLHPAQKAAVAALGSLGALIRPARADLVAAVGETTGLAALERARQRMLADPVGRQVLQDRPRVTDDTMALCEGMPDSSFGHEYLRFMSDRHFHADDRPPVRFIDDPELAYIAARAREVHDFWHVLFDCHTNVFGELALKALEFVQTGLPMTGLAVAGAQYRLKQEDRLVLWRDFVPWAVRAGMRCPDLLCLYYEQHLGEELHELRLRWRILTAPQPPAHLQPRLRGRQAAAQVQAAQQQEVQHAERQGVPGIREVGVVRQH